jgi:formamidopyrimidine-DNA glycosylase
VPELPDVEGFRRDFRRHARDKEIVKLGGDADIIRNSSPQGLGRAFKGRSFGEPRRHGKWLICPTDKPLLLFHFGMTGGLIWSGEEPERHRHDRLFLEFSDGELRYRNMRKLGGVWIAKGDDDLEAVLGKFGPDAEKVGRDEFTEMLERRRGSIKAALMDQKFMAGLGNLTVDESLWHARIAPKRQVATLEDKERNALHRSTQKVLRDSIKVGYVPAKKSWLTGARDRRDKPCPRCKASLMRAKVAGRTTYWCPQCQPNQT